MHFLVNHFSILKLLVLLNLQRTILNASFENREVFDTDMFFKSPTMCNDYISNELDCSEDFNDDWKELDHQMTNYPERTCSDNTRVDNVSEDTYNLYNGMLSEIFPPTTSKPHNSKFKKLNSHNISKESQNTIRDADNIITTNNFQYTLNYEDSYQQLNIPKSLADNSENLSLIRASAITESFKKNISDILNSFNGSIKSIERIKASISQDELSIISFDSQIENNLKHKIDKTINDDQFSIYRDKESTSVKQKYKEYCELFTKKRNLYTQFIEYNIHTPGHYKLLNLFKKEAKNKEKRLNKTVYNHKRRMLTKVKNIDSVLEKKEIKDVYKFVKNEKINKKISKKNNELRRRDRKKKQKRKKSNLTKEFDKIKKYFKDMEKEIENIAEDLNTRMGGVKESVSGMVARINNTIKQNCL